MYAHSPPKDDPSRLPHLYADHIREVERLGLEYLDQMLVFSGISADEKSIEKESLRLALQIHDIGKLESGNQDILSGRQTGKLMYDHIDAGVAIALELGDLLATWLIRAHHAPGLANMSTEKNMQRLYGSHDMLRGRRWHRDGDGVFFDEHMELITKTDSIKSDIKNNHQRLCNHILCGAVSAAPKDAFLTRLLLSCLVDADHGDTSTYYSQSQGYTMPDCRWNDRLEKLRIYVGNLDAGQAERKELRDELFDQCLNFNTEEEIVSCSAPVGLGKTTSVLAYLLRCAADKDNGLRRIFVVAPFTNVISQTARTLRKALVLDGEDPNLIVAEHHHRAEFSDPELRTYSQLWRAPIVVTTAVQFFETLASANPSSLRKLHMLPGSAIFVDECHACVPTKLMKQTWVWLEKIAKDWGCRIVLASGSLSKYWEKEEIVGEENVRTIPSIFSSEFSTVANKTEYRRVSFKRINEGRPIELDTLLEYLSSSSYGESSRLVILNTVHSAASVARKLQPAGEDKCSLQDRTVLHLSTALTPRDRERVIDEIVGRQSPRSGWKQRGWILVATSCVEAGVDLDFDIGFRERFSLTSFLQTAGRVNREGLNSNSVLYDFSLISGDLITAHPGAAVPSLVFELAWPYLVEGKTPLDELSTRALISETTKQSDTPQIRNLVQDEDACNFQNVQEHYRVIESSTFTVVIDSAIADRLRQGLPTKFHDIQRNSVQIWANKVSGIGLVPIDALSKVYGWPYGYDPDFLGYMSDPRIFRKGIGLFV